MTVSIAVAGKGGTGKTTVCAVLIRELLALGKKPLLAVDADPNSNLNEHLGMECGATIADIRDEVRDGKKIPAGMSKPDYVNLKLSQAVIEGDGFDLLVMGRPEGKGCYCYVNELLRGFLAKASKNYACVVIDNEAGMEHLSRRTTDNVDILLVVVNPDPVSVNAGRRIMEMTKDEKFSIGKAYYLVNRAPRGFDAKSAAGPAGGLDGAPVAGVLPEADEIRYKVPVAGDTALNAELRKIIGEIMPGPGKK